MASAAAAAEESREVWISHRTGERPGGGSKHDPLNGATQERFDAVMAMLPPGSRVHLGRGVFTTRGVHLKEGWRLSGMGKNATTIRLADGVAAADGSSAFVLANFDWQGFYERVAISDLTIDCNRANQPAFRDGLKGNLTALTTACRHARIRRVRAIGTWSNPGEGFPFSVLSAGSSNGSNRVEIDACENLAPIGSLTAISAFDQSGGRLSGFIRNCLVTDGPESASFGAGGWKNFAVMGNRTRNMGAGIVIDTHDYENVLIERNRFYATKKWGLLYNGGGLYRNIVVRRNYFEMAPSAEWCLATSNARVTTRIEKNTFIQNSMARPAFWIGPRTAGSLRDNVVDGTAPNDLPRSPHLRLENNRDLRGRIVALRGSSER